MATETLVYRLGYEDGPFQEAIKNRALSKDATIDDAKAFLAPIWAVTITSTNDEDTDGTNLDPFMAQYGFSRLTLTDPEVLDTVSHWGSFDVKSAPHELAVEGNIAYCVDGFSGSPGPVWYNGTTWLNSDRSLLSDGSGVNVASINNGGSYPGADGNYTATQASTSGAGQNAVFTVSVASGAVTSVVSVDNRGYSYAATDTITLSIPDLTETTAAILNVDSIT